MSEEQLDNDVEDQEVSVEIEDTSEDQVERVSVSDADEEDQFERASNATQKRINQLTKKMRQAEREREEAIRYAQQVQSESTSLKEHLNTLDSGYITEFSGRVQSELATAENALKNAMEIGDTQGVVEANRRITALAIQADRAAQARRDSQIQKQHAELQRQQMIQARQQPAAPRRPDPKAEAWASEREWFGSDETMTYAAFGIHKQLIEDEGIDPSSDEYYSELDKRMAEAFPHKFKNGPKGKRPAQTVASVNRSASSGRGKKQVRLTSNQVIMAKKLGVPLEEYAKYVKE
jgi:hypothetical protein